MAQRPRVLYAHGFASSPASTKGKAYDAHLSSHGYRVERLDLRLVDRDHLRLSAMIAHMRARAAEAPPCVLIGSSLGGLTAAHVATDDTVIAAVLMAPAFGFAERWQRSLGPAQLERWRAGEPLMVDDHAGGPPLAIDYGFYRDAAAIDAQPPEPSCPLLVFHGRHDEVVPIEGSRQFVDHSPNATLVELDDDHALTASLELMLPAVLRFLDHVLPRSRR